MAEPDLLPAVRQLPDALEGVKSFADWSRRRSDIGHLIQHYGIGTKPTVGNGQVVATMEGDTTLVVYVTVGNHTLKLRSTIHYPKQGQPPYALMIGTSGISLPRQLFDGRPIARMTFHEAQVNDYSQWRKHHERGEHPFDQLYPQLKDNGAYSEWAWGLSRLIDGLQQLGPEVTRIDTRRIGVTGCSYAGKMALYCGAFDERVALTIAQEPGGGGAASWRASHETTKNVESLDKTDYHWFLESQRQHFGGDNVYRLPYDQHELCAMVCPRALLLLGNPDYEWLADESMLVSAKAASEVWRRFGIADRMDWSIVGGHGHCQLPESQFPIVESFLDRFLLGHDNPSQTVSAPKLVSPNGKIAVEVEHGRFLVSYQGRMVLQLQAAEADLPLPQLKAVRVKADYEMLSGKRHHCANEANEYSIGQLTLRLYNDGVAYRYEKPVREQAAYIIPEGTRRWMQQWCDSYEGFFPLATSCKQKAVPSYGRQYKDADGNCVRWGFPALLEPRDGVFALLTEANIERGQSASSLYNEGEVFRVVSDEGENRGHTPWRVVIVGTLADIIQSTLVTDVSEPCRLEDTRWIKPGVASWIYWAYNHGSNDYNIIKQYVDMADTLHLPYVLIDAEWDEMKNGKTLEDAVGYARSKGVKPLVWYNSSVGWIDGAPTPKFRLNKPEDREREFAWLEKMGVAGVKIDFFSGDNQRNMDYCIDLLESAAQHHLLVNFHGATVPRGWQRTYPNLMTTEGVYGAEWYNNVATFTDKAASHNATLPFTRNVIGPMDYTPCTFSDSQHPHITTNGHELALTVLFESALQHLADRPESYLAQPLEVQQFLSHLPTVWDETRLVSGYPGESVVIARRCGATWYVAGINGTDQPLTVKTPLHYIQSADVTTFMDGEPWTIKQEHALPTSVDLKPRGGFVIVAR